MGVVYDALQTEPIRRRVALKVIKLGMDTAQVAARFEAERQALAVMDHPNIAKVFDAGTSDTGRPYFVMEQVQGIPITEYCDQHTLSTAERLSLFVAVCRGVQHAHQKGVIHRDLKPSNVLVVDEDQRGVPKIIDFGIAKAIAWRLTEETLVTDLGQAIGTPAYMSPEQAHPSGLDVDTRADVYSLGVILYELLVGCLPSDLGDGDLKTFLARLASHTTDPPTPSQRLSRLGDDGITIARLRQTDSRTLQRELHGDLDWIVMKAMEPDRGRRYGTADELAAEIHRYRHHDLILARPPSVRYRVSKFVRRNRLAVTAATTVAASLLLGTVSTGVGIVRATRAEGVAAQEADVAQQVSAFLEGLFQVSAPMVARGSTITAREILDRGAERIGDELQDQPLLRARLTGTIGRVYADLGLYERARGQLEQALQLRQSTWGDNHRDVAESLFGLGLVAHRQGQYAEAESLFNRATSIGQRSLETDDPLLADSYQWLGRALYDQGRRAEAASIWNRVLAMRQLAVGTDDPSYAWTLYLSALCHMDERRYDEAENALRRSLTILERAGGEDEPRLAAVLQSLSYLYRLLERYGEAEQTARRAVVIREQIWGPDHRLLARALMLLGRLNTRLARYAEADSLLQRSVAISERHLGPQHPELAENLTALGWLYHDMGREAEAESLYVRAVSIQESTLGPDHLRLALSLNDLATIAATQGKRSAAEEYLQRGLTIREAALEPDDPAIATSIANLANLLRDGGRHAEADSLYLRALRIWESTLGPGHPEVAWLLTNRATSYKQQGRYAEAEELYVRALTIREEAVGANHNDVAWQLEHLGRLYLMREEYAEAELVYARVLTIGEQALAPRHEYVLHILAILEDLYRRQGKLTAAAEVEPRIESVIGQTMSSYASARTRDSTVSAQSWNELCWLGSLSGRATLVIDACDAAVGLAPRNAEFRDSRGVARALSGDISGAIEDFELFVAADPARPHREQRQRWITALRAARNPFTADLLLTLLAQ